MLNKIQQKHLKVICIFFLTFTLVFSMFKTVYADNVDVLNAPETVSVQTLENELKTATNETNTDRVKYVDVKGNPIENAPTTIPFGTISDHKDLKITGKNYEFKSAKVNDKDCVYIGKYENTIYYSTDGNIAIKLKDDQKLIMTYQEYYNITVKEDIPEGGVAGTITTKEGTLDTSKTVRVNAGDDLNITVTPAVVNKIRYKISSVESQNNSTINRSSGDEYGAAYTIQFQKDDVIKIAYSSEGVYRVTINKTANDGTEYLNEEHSKDALNFTFTEKDLDADGAIRIPVIHTKRGYRLINMAINGTTLAETTDNHREIPTEKGNGHGITMDANCGNTSYLVTVVMEDSYTSNLNGEKNCSYAYSIKVKPRRGSWQDINLNLVPYAIGEQVLTAKLYTDGHRSGGGLDVVMWNPDTKTLDPIRDSDTVNMDSVGGHISDTLNKRQVRMFFAKSKNGYSSPIPGFKSLGTETVSGSMAQAYKGEVSDLSATTMGETGTFAIYDDIWQDAKQAALSAGYTAYVVFGGEKTLREWEMYVVSFTTYAINYYVHYKSGLEDDLDVSNIPDNQELYNKIPMHSYGNNPSTAKGGRKIGVSFTVGEGNEEPTCSGYEFLGWKLQKKDGTLSNETYQNKDVFTVSLDNIEFADNMNLPFCSRNNEKGYQFVAQWKKIGSRNVIVNHYLKTPDGNEKLKKTTEGSITFAEDNETVTAISIPENDGTFPGYVFDKDDTRNELEKEVTNDDSTETIKLNLYYKPTTLTIKKSVEGYILDENKSYNFIIKATPPSNDSGKSLDSADIYIGQDKKITFTNNQATFALKKDESINLNCLPIKWTYTITESDPGSNFKVYYKLNDSSKSEGKTVDCIMDNTGKMTVEFINTSTIAPPETGISSNEKEYLAMMIVGLVLCFVMLFYLKNVKRKKM